MGHKWFADVVFEYLAKNRDVEVGIQELMEETGRDRHQVQGAINNLRKRKQCVIQAPVPGRVFVYRGMGTPDEAMASSPSQITQKKLEAVMSKTEERIAQNPENRPTVTVIKPGIGTVPVPEKGKFIMPSPSKDNEFFRVISRNSDRVLLEDAGGKVWRATEI